MESRGKSPSTSAGDVRRPRAADPLANRPSLAGEEPRHRSLDVEKERQLGVGDACAAPATDDRVQAISVEANLPETVRLPQRTRRASRDPTRSPRSPCRQTGPRCLPADSARSRMGSHDSGTRSNAWSPAGSAGGRTPFRLPTALANRERARAPRCRRRHRERPARTAQQGRPISQIRSTPAPAISTPDIRSAACSPPAAAAIVDVPARPTSSTRGLAQQLRQVGLDELEAGVVAHGVRNVGGLGNSIQRERPSASACRSHGYDRRTGRRFRAHPGISGSRHWPANRAIA